MGLFRRRREDEDPLAALRGDGSLPLGAMRSTVPAAATPAPSPGGPGPGGGRILSRRDTGIDVAGVPRVRLQVEVLAGPGAPFVTEVVVLAAPGAACEPGAAVDVVWEDGRVRYVRLRPAIRPA